MRRAGRGPHESARAVEELLGINRLSETGQVRVATEDVELAGTTVNAGDGLLAAIGAANRDPAAFRAHRGAGCPARPVAGLRLAVPPDDVAWRRSLIRGPAELPVRW